MDKLLKKTPLPMAGLMLSLAAIGNLFQSYGEVYRSIFGIISGSILALILAKIILYPKEVKEELKNPVIASVFPTLTMGIILLSAYLKPLVSTNIAFYIWVLGVSCHILLMIKFSKKHLVNFDIKIA